MRKILLMWLPSAGKTRLVVSQLEYLPKPIIFYSELAKDVLETMDGSLDETDVILRTPNIDELESLDDIEYNTIIIEHLLRVKNIQNVRIRSKMMDLLERSKKQLIIIVLLNLMTLKILSPLFLWLSSFIFKTYFSGKLPSVTLRFLGTTSWIEPHHIRFYSSQYCVPFLSM